jgi:hypothetical protein
MVIIQITMLWPKFIFSKLFRPEDLSPTLRRAIYLLNNDLDTYAHEFSSQILSIRITGILALLMSSCVVLLEVLSRKA